MGGSLTGVRHRGGASASAVNSHAGAWGFGRQA